MFYSLFKAVGLGESSLMGKKTTNELSGNEMIPTFIVLGPRSFHKRHLLADQKYSPYASLGELKKTKHIFEKSMPTYVSVVLMLHSEVNIQICTIRMALWTAGRKHND